MQKTLLKIVLINILITNGNIKAQDSLEKVENLRFVAIEANTSLIFSEIPKYDFIRGDVLPYSGGGTAQTLSGFVTKNQVGIKTEFRNNTKKWGILFGIKYSRMNINIGKESLYGSNSKYFYLLDNQSGTTTEYFRVNEINRKIDFIGTPVELRWYSKSNKIFKLCFKLCFKLGMELDYKINSTSNVVFYNKNMSENEDIVLNKFDNPNSFYSSVYFATGCNFDQLPVDIELVIPYIVLTPNMTGIIKPRSGIGINLSFRLPY